MPKSSNPSLDVDVDNAHHCRSRNVLLSVFCTAGFLKVLGQDIY